MCSAGVCGVACLGGSTLCSNKCVDVQNDAANCGGCGKACAAGQVCSAGVCGVTCLGGSTLCSNKCVDVKDDAANCGGCAKACAAGQVCSNGTCAVTCLGGSTLCANKCVDEQNDAANCGGCGVACAAGQVCAAGKCGITCLGGTTLCGNVCSNTSYDPANCGGCGKPCSAGANQSAFCSSGACATKCSAGFGDCDGNAANGCEANTKTDAKNCGGCGIVCPQYDVCTNGACVVGPVGSYDVISGPAWGSNPPTYTCQEACALLFGGIAGQYGCSTVNGSVNHTANTTIWGVSGCAIVADTFKKNTSYNCGSANCSQSAYCADNCSGVNYCFR